MTVLRKPLVHRGVCDRETELVLFDERLRKRRSGARKLPIQPPPFGQAASG